MFFQQILDSSFCCLFRFPLVSFMARQPFAFVPGACSPRAQTLISMSYVWNGFVCAIWFFIWILKCVIWFDIRIRFRIRIGIIKTFIYLQLTVSQHKTCLEKLIWHHPQTGWFQGLGSGSPSRWQCAHPQGHVYIPWSRRQVPRYGRLRC